jgi:hypothetical protein
LHAAHSVAKQFSPLKDSENKSTHAQSPQDDEGRDGHVALQSWIESALRTTTFSNETTASPPLIHVKSG